MRKYKASVAAVSTDQITIQDQQTTIQVLGVPYISASLYCKLRNLPNTDIHNYSIYLR